MEKITWEALEYEPKKKHNDWFWGLGIISFAIAIVSIIYKNYLFAIFIVMGAIIMAVYSIRPPKSVAYELNAKGLIIDKFLYPYKKIKSFHIDVANPEKKKLLVLTERAFMPLLVIPIDDLNEEEVLKMFEGQVEDREMTEPMPHKVMDILGF